MTYLELVAAANTGDGKARIELAIIEGRMLNEGVLPDEGWPSRASEIVQESTQPIGA